VLVPHACNPSYSGGKDQEDCGSKPTQANSSGDPISKNPSQKRAGGVAKGVGPEFKPKTECFPPKSGKKTRDVHSSMCLPLLFNILLETLASKIKQDRQK
jgi:hypothetical protein